MRRFLVAQFSIIRKHLIERKLLDIEELEHPAPARAQDALAVWSKRTDPGQFRESDHQINGVVVR